ncbi:MAG: hypothetical protein ACR2MP_08105 [Streptosporangiaceae bacterium]
MTARLAALAAAHARILARRRTALLVLALLPLAFYAALYRHNDHAIAVGGIASAFSAGGASIFSMLPARAADRRLVLIGYRVWLLILGRLVVLEAGSLVISAVTAAVMIAGSGPAHPGDAFAGVILVGAVAVPLGLALGALLPRELEATLVLIGFVGIQLTSRSDTAISRFLPFHAAAQLLDASVGAPASIWPRLVMSAGWGIGLAAVAWLSWLRRVALRGSRRGVQAGRAIDLYSR